MEAALALHARVKDRLDHVSRIHIRTQESALRIIDKKGPLHNPADRDHCLQYAVAVALIHGDLRAEHYEEQTARDPRIGKLRDCMQLEEDPRYTAEYLDPEKRSIANSVQVFFDDGSFTEKVAVEYPIGHQRRRSEALPLLWAKLRQNLSTQLIEGRAEAIVELFQDRERLSDMTVPHLIELFL